MELYRKIFKIALFGVLMVAFLGCGKIHHQSSEKLDPVHFKSVSELTGAIRRGEITSLELLNIYFDRIQMYNQDINAVVAMDMDAARTRAVEADKALARGENWGPLHGLPMTVKDVFEVVGLPATSGDPKLKDYFPEKNALAVQRLMDAGAIIFGKTNVPYHALDIQSYNAIYGTTNNPWDLSRTPGGSSGGSAAALAAGFTALELGSDLGGSIRFPAHYTGVFGHKPTFGIVPRYGHIPPMPGEVSAEFIPKIPLFVVGPLARSADDLRIALDVLTTPGSKDEIDGRPLLLPSRKQRFNDFRVAVWFTDSYPNAEIDHEVSVSLQKAVTLLRKAGVNIDEEARPDMGLEHINFIFGEIYYRLMIRALPLPDWLIEKQKELEAMWAGFFEQYDVLLAPVSPTVAFPHNQEGTLITRSLMINGQEKPMLANMAWAWMAIVCGLPATVAPIGMSDSGLPVGIQIIGARYEDHTTIAFAQGLSEIVGGFVAPPRYGN